MSRDKCVFSPYTKQGMMDHIRFNELKFNSSGESTSLYNDLVVLKYMMSLEERVLELEEKLKYVEDNSIN